MVHRRFGSVAIAARKRKARKSKAAHSPRTSVTFPAELYQNLEALAKRKKVSIAWVVREAAEKYVNDQWPLLGHSKTA